MATYKMKTGDTPERVSAKFGITVLDLYKANKGVYQYRGGATVNIPPSPTGGERYRKGGGGYTYGAGKKTYGTYGAEVLAERELVKTKGRGTTPTTGWAPPKPFGSTTATQGGGGGEAGANITYEQAEERYYSSGAYMQEADWSATMGANLGEMTREWWDSGYRPERMTQQQAADIGIEENWMRENGYVLIGDTWCLSAQTKYWQQNYGGDGTFDYGDDAKDVPEQPKTKTYTQNTQWRVATG